MTYSQEAALLEPVSGYIRRKSFRCQEYELGFYEYRIDLYGFSPVRNETIAVELKLRDWRRAIEQAIVYQLCADYVSVALPARFATGLDSDLLQDEGIGLIKVYDSGVCRQAVAPKRSPCVREAYRDEYIRILRGGSHAKWQP